jgi:predicted Zn-dependent protease
VHAQNVFAASHIRCMQRVIHPPSALPMPSSPSLLTQQLDNAARLMQAGRFVDARRLLEQVVHSSAGVSRAHWLLAGALLNTGDLLGAEREARMAVATDSRNPAPLALLGDILVAQGRLPEAETALRQALAVEPRHVPAATLLAKVLLALNLASDALQLIDDFLRNLQPVPELLLLRARALLATADHARAIPAFRQAMAAAPADVNARLGLAASLADSGQHAAAEETLRGAIGHGMDGAGVRYVLARALAGQRRFEEAETEFRTAIHLRPDYTEAHINLAETFWMRTGDAHAVAAEIDASLRKVPSLTALRILKAKLLEASGGPDAALGELDSAIANAPNDPALQIAAAQIAVKCDAQRALLLAEHACKLVPGDPLARSTYGNALLATGRAGEAEALAARLLATTPSDGLALALRATAWRMLGDPRYRDLYDYGHFVQPAMLDTPGGWPDLPAYLDDLAHALLNLHALRTHPIGQSLRHGTQVDLVLEHADDPAIRAFAQAIDGPIQRYMASLGEGNDPFRCRNTRRYRLSGVWSVRLRPNGYHFNHYHPDGWLSSACYIQLPQTLGTHGGEGWLQFGEPAFPTTPALPAEYLVRPRPGLLVLFPAWFWHGTVPFSGAPGDSRLTIAFDVIPA